MTKEANLLFRYQVSILLIFVSISTQGIAGTPDINGLENFQNSYYITNTIADTTSSEESMEPQITWVSEMTRTWYDNDTFSLEFTVNFTGADYINVEIEEEYDYNVRTYRFYGPDTAQITTGKMSCLYYSWVTIRVKNQYGEARRTFEFPPTFGDVDINCDNSSEIHIYNLEGVEIYKGDTSGFDILPTGIYIKCERKPTGETSTSKIIVE